MVNVEFTDGTFALEVLRLSPLLVLDCWQYFIIFDLLDLLVVPNLIGLFFY